ncbi:hypothetical protein C0J52_00662 [Blattella germanica]|nr:hypothetical protein C0J52_00662 [Blattella germanica]PSN56868.1 hypothetical protein C0J52_00662 [Blattella germanica]
MHIVDLADQYLALYPFTRKTIKWLKKLFLYLIQCTLFNAFILHKKLKRPTEKIVDFVALMQKPASSVTSSHSKRPSFSTEVAPPQRAPAIDLIARIKIMCNIIFP